MLKSPAARCRKASSGASSWGGRDGGAGTPAWSKCSRMRNSCIRSITVWRTTSRVLKVSALQKLAPLSGKPSPLRSTARPCTASASKKPMERMPSRISSGVPPTGLEPKSRDSSRSTTSCRDSGRPSKRSRMSLRLSTGPWPTASMAMTAMPLRARALAEAIASKRMLPLPWQ